MWGFFLRYIYIIIHENAEYHLPYSNFYTQTIKFTNIKLQAIHCLKISQQSTPPIQKPLINPQLHRCLNSTFPRQPLPSAAVFSESQQEEKISHQFHVCPMEIRLKNCGSHCYTIFAFRGLSEWFGQRNPVGYFFSRVPSEPAPFRLSPNKTYAIPPRCDKISLDYDKTEEFSYDI